MNCKNCNTNFEGNFCNNCGEKVVRDGDFALMKIGSQALDSITHLDSKLFKTFKLLLFYPGKLSTYYIEGIRIPYMKPFQIFIISNIIFFFIFSNEDLFKVPSSYFFKENFDGLRILEKVRIISTERDLEVAEIANLYDNASTNLAKGLLVFLIPLLALIGILLNYKQKMEFGKHLIFSTHFFTFVLSFFSISSLFLGLLTDSSNRRLVLIPIGIVILLYYSIALKNFYYNSIKLAFIKGICGVFLIFMLFNIYKMLISILALYTI